MFLVKYVFYITCEVSNNYISFVASPLLNINIAHFTREIKDIFNKKHLNIPYLFKKYLK